MVNNAGEEKELFRGGDKIPVTGENYIDYVKLCQKYRIDELKEQCLAIRTGISLLHPLEC